MTDEPRPPLGRGLLSGGYVLVSLGLGIAFGYWASDFEMRFFPTVVVAILLLLTAGLALFALGAQIEREQNGRRRIGRRAAASAAFAVAALGGIVAAALSSRPTALTQMPDSDLRRTHEIARSFLDDAEKTIRRFDFVYYLEGREREERTAVADVESFLATAERSKWDFGDE